MTLPQTVFVLAKGEVLPVRINLETDGNGNDLANLDGLLIEVPTYATPVRCDSVPVVTKSTVGPGDNQIAVAGRVCFWTWTAADLLLMGEISEGILEITDSNGYLMRVWNFIIRKEC